MAQYIYLSGLNVCLRHLLKRLSLILRFFKLLFEEITVTLKYVGKGNHLLRYKITTFLRNIFIT